jgi:hypothetical protein
VLVNKSSRYFSVIESPQLRWLADYADCKVSGLSNFAMLFLEL